MIFRNVILFVVFIWICGCSSREHLVFNNVPIDGHLVKFAETLTKSGFSITDSTKRGEIILKGEIFNKDCKINVLGTFSGNLAYKVIVSLQEEIHDSLQSDFGKIQQQFALKYGPGTSQYQKYKKRERLLYNVPGLVLELKAGDFTRYITDSGEIRLEVLEGYICITYLDKQNNEIRIAEREMGR